MLQYYAPSLTKYQRLKTKEVSVGNLLIGGNNPIRIQTMTTTDTMDTEATVAQTIRCIEAGAELVRITAPSKKEAENLAVIKQLLLQKGYNIPLVADIHFTPNAAEIAARIVQKVRVNPGNYVDKKRFDFIEYDDAAYAAEIDRIRQRFTPLVRICKTEGTAMRIGTNHGSLSDRIMSRYGDTANGMVESAMEFLRIARNENYHQIVLSMKSSNPLVMVQAYRLLVRNMDEEFGECYPLHLGVTEAGDGEDGRIKSAIGIGTLLEDGIGDTIRVSLTEDPEFEIPVCRDIVSRYAHRPGETNIEVLSEKEKITLPYNPFSYQKRTTRAAGNIGGSHVPVVVADFSTLENITPGDIAACGYHYNEATDKWNIGDAAADYLFTGNAVPDFPLPGTLRVVCNVANAISPKNFEAILLRPLADYLSLEHLPDETHFINLDANTEWSLLLQFLKKAKQDQHIVVCISSSNQNAMPSVRRFLMEMMQQQVLCPAILRINSTDDNVDAALIHFATEAGALFLEGFGDGIWLWNDASKLIDQQISGRTYLPVNNNRQFLNNTAFSILQAARTRISKTEYISCPSCGRTLFDLQETTTKIRAATHHLKGLKIAIMGCIVNGPGEMADADFGYVGSGPGKITLYKGKEVMKRNVPSETAVQELIELLKESDVWIPKQAMVI